MRINWLSQQFAEEIMCRNQIWTPFWSFLCLPSCFNTPHIFRHAWKLPPASEAPEPVWLSQHYASLPPTQIWSQPPRSNIAIRCEREFHLTFQAAEEDGREEEDGDSLQEHDGTSEGFFPPCCLLSSCAVFISLLSPSLPLFFLSYANTPTTSLAPPLVCCFHSRSISPHCWEMHNSLQLTRWAVWALVRRVSYSLKFRAHCPCLLENLQLQSS